MAPLFLALAQLAPTLLQFVGKPGAAEVAKKAVEVAQAVTGTDTPESALDALKSNPDAVLAYQRALLEQQSEFARLAVRQEEIAAGTIKDVNTTMQAEAGSEHWPTYSWRPFIGFMFGAYIGSMWLLPLFGKQPAPLSPDLTLAIGAILGVASWFRGKMQADPNIPTVNRG